VNEPIYPSAEKTIGEFKGKEMKFPERISLPYRRFLSYHAKWVYHEVMQKGWIENCNAFKDFSYSPMGSIKLTAIQDMEALGKNSKVATEGR
jgi:hypothetical protein